MDLNLVYLFEAGQPGTSMFPSHSESSKASEESFLTQYLVMFRNGIGHKATSEAMWNQVIQLLHILRDCQRCPLLRAGLDALM